MKRLSLKQLFILVAGVLVLGFLSFGLFAFIQFEKLSVNGPIYKKIIDGKDLVADILPPPLYVIEANLVAHSMLVESSSTKIKTYQQQIQTLKNDFIKRESYWAASSLNPSLAKIVKNELIPTGNDFFNTIESTLSDVDSSITNDQRLVKLQQIDTAFNKHRDVVDKLVSLANSYNQNLEKNADQDLSNNSRLLIGIFLVSLIVSVTVALRASVNIRTQLGAEPAVAHEYVSHIANGNLRAQSSNTVPQNSLMANIISMQLKISDIVYGIDTISKEMTQSIFHIALTSKEISQSTDTQTQETVAVDRATKDLSNVLVSVREITEHARLKTHDVEQRAEAGLRSLSEIITQMDVAVESVSASESSVKSLASAGIEINSIVASIKTISDQTNLLALNAAIEAARAGEQGRGFAVVADEVRTLAIKTGDATVVIQRIVDDLNQKIQTSLNAMTNVSAAVKLTQSKAQQNGDAIKEMANEARESSQYSLQIASISEEQIHKIGMLDHQLQKLFNAMKSNFSTLDFIASISAALHRAVDSLQDKIKFFQFDAIATQYQIDNEKREHKRLLNSLFLTVYFNDEQIFARTKDFSLGGLSFITRVTTRLQKGDLIDVHIRPPASQVDGFFSERGFEVKGRVVRDSIENNEHIYGISFEELTPTAQSELKDIIKFYNT